MGDRRDGGDDEMVLRMICAARKAVAYRNRAGAFPAHRASLMAMARSFSREVMVLADEICGEGAELASKTPSPRVG